MLKTRMTDLPSMRLDMTSRGLAKVPLRLPSFLVLVFTVAIANAAESATNRFGFAGKEIFPVEHGISHLNAADLDGDGLKDLVVVNNLRSLCSTIKPGRPNWLPRPNPKSNVS
jgi:hypothetical protein